MKISRTIPSEKEGRIGHGDDETFESQVNSKTKR